VWHILADLDGVELLLCNAHHVKRVPGRKTDVSDAAWLAQLCEVGLLTGSFVPPPEIARLRDLTRYRKKLINERGRETQRIQKLLEDTGIKLDNVANDILGKSARAMLEALIDGERDPAVLAELARTRMRAKLPELRLALGGRFNDHHALMLRLHLDHVDHLSAMVDRLDQEVDRAVGPFLEPMRRLQTIPGVGQRTAEVMLAEMGADMTRFPTPQQLASWAGLCPRTTNRVANAAPAEPARATPHCAPRCAKRPGSHHGPTAPTSPPSSVTSADGSASGVRTRPSSPSPTPCSSSPGTCSRARSTTRTLASPSSNTATTRNAGSAT
jgi:transposase